MSCHFKNALFSEDIITEIDPYSHFCQVIPLRRVPEASDHLLIFVIRRKYNLS